MNKQVQQRWFGTDLNQAIAGWSPSTQAKVKAIGYCKTMHDILAKFDKTSYKPFKHTKQFANWEYMVLLKCVYLGQLEPSIIKVKNRDTLAFKRLDNPIQIS